MRNGRGINGIILGIKIKNLRKNFIHKALKDKLLRAIKRFWSKVRAIRPTGSGDFK